MSLTFKDIPIKHGFICNGTKYVKCSSRTARNIDTARLFYFSQNDKCYNLDWKAK